MKNLVEEQLKLEQEGVNYGIQKYREEARKAKERGEMSDTAPGMSLLQASVAPFAGALETYRTQGGRRPTTVVKTQKFLNMFDSMIDVSYIVCRSVIDMIGADVSKDSIALQTILIKIVNRLQDHFDYTSYKKENPNYLKSLEKHLNKRDSQQLRHRRITIKHGFEKLGINPHMWNDVDKVTVGAKIIELLIESTGLVRKEFDDRKKMYTLVPASEILEWLEEEHSRCELLQPFFLPMLVEPLPWEQGLYDGGYLTKASSKYRVPIVRTRDKQTLSILKQSTSLDNTRQVLNTLQSTKWRINKQVFGVMEQAWQAGGGLGKLPETEEEPLPLQPWGNLNKQEFEAYKRRYPEIVKEWKHRAADVYDRRRREKSKRASLAGKLYAANLMKQYDHFYFVWNCDWRGRLYPVAAGMHPQADDSGKALLEFAEGKPLGKTGVRWLKIHIANTFGNDKCSFDKRCKWVEDCEKEVLMTASDPLGLGKDFWQEADKPFQFLAACFEYRGYKLEGESYVSHLPVAQDGSCNGLQNLSAMLKDTIGGQAVNLVPSKAPQDVYTQVMKRLLQNLETELEESEDLEMYKVWKGKIDRKIVKRPVMTVPYGVTFVGIRDQILDEVKMRSKGVPYIECENLFQACTWLAKYLKDAINEVVIASKEVMDWLKEISKVIGKEAGQGLLWHTPAGFPVFQHYLVDKRKRISTFWGTARIRIDLSISQQTDKLDTRGQVRGISPNFVHSYDACHLMLTVLEANKQGIDNFCMIHDSFSCHACDSDKLARILREQFITIYKNNVLEGLRNQVLEQIPSDLHKKIPEAPTLGNLDISEVINSKYFFH